MKLEVGKFYSNISNQKVQILKAIGCDKFLVGVDDSTDWYIVNSEGKHVDRMATNQVVSSSAHHLTGVWKDKIKVAVWGNVYLDSAGRSYISSVYQNESTARTYRDSDAVATIKLVGEGFADA